MVRQCFFRDYETGNFKGFRYEHNSSTLIYDYWLKETTSLQPGSAVILTYKGILYKGFVSPSGGCIAIEVI